MQGHRITSFSIQTKIHILIPTGNVHSIKSTCVMIILCRVLIKCNIKAPGLEPILYIETTIMVHGVILFCNEDDHFSVLYQMVKSVLSL